MALDDARTITAGFHAEHAVVQFTVNDLAADHEVVVTAPAFHRDIQLGVQGVLVAFEIALGAWQECVFHQVTTCLAAHPGIRAGGASGGIVAVHVAMAQAFFHGEGQGPAIVGGFHVGQGDEAVAPVPAPAVGYRPVFAGEFLLVDVADARGCGPDAVDAVHGAQRVGDGAQVVDEGRVVIDLLGGVVIQAQVLLFADQPLQGDACGFVGVLHGATTTTERGAALVRVSSRVVDHFIAGRGGFALVARTTHAQAKPICNERAGEREVEGGVGTEIVVRLQAVANRGRSMPAIRYRASDDVDHAAQCICAVQGGGGAADHFDAFNGIQRRDVVELVATKAVGIDVAVVVLALAVDQDQGVLRAHAAHADGALAGLVRGFAHVHAFKVTHRVDQRDVGALGEFFARHHADTGGRVGDLLLETACGDYHRFQILRAGGRRFGLCHCRCGKSHQQGAAKYGAAWGITAWGGSGHQISLARQDWEPPGTTGRRKVGKWE